MHLSSLRHEPRYRLELAHFSFSSSRAHDLAVFHLLVSQYHALLLILAPQRLVDHDLDLLRDPLDLGRNDPLDELLVPLARLAAFLVRGSRRLDVEIEVVEVDEAREAQGRAAG